MSTLLQQLAEATRTGNLQPMVKKGPVSIYQPQQAIRQATAARPAPQARPVPAPRSLRERDQAAARGPIDSDALLQAFASTPEAAKQAKEQYQKTAPKPDLPWWKDALGVTLGNPVTKSVLTALGPLGTLRKAATLGVEEGAEHYQDVPDWLKGALDQIGVGKILGAVDTKRTEADKRSNWSKLAPNSDYGFGQLLNPDNPAWANRIAGFVGDVALDPLTYLTGGSYKAAQGGAEAAKAAKEASLLARASELAGEEAPIASRAAARLSSAGGPVTEEAAARWAAQGVKETAIHGAKGRAGLVADYLVNHPDVPVELQQQMLRGAERGFNTLAPEAREALGVARPGLRVRGLPGAVLPGSGKPVELAARVTGAARAGLNEIPAVSKAFRGPKGLEDATAILRKGAEATPDQVHRAAIVYQAADQIRLGKGAQQASGNRRLVDLVRNTFKKMSKNDIRQMVVDSELSDEPTAINKTLSSIRQTYRDISGDPAPSSIAEDRYLPHMMTPGARRMISSKANDPVVRDFLDHAGIKTEQLLEGSPFIDLARVFKPDLDEAGNPVPKMFKLGDKELWVERGDIGELNQKLGELFPGFKGKFYQDDPVHIVSSYVDSLAKGAGARKARNWMAQSGTPMVRTIEGELGDEFAAHQEALANQFPAADVVRQGAYDPAAAAPVIPEAPAVPESDVFKPQVAREATRERNTMLKTQGRVWAQAAEKDVKTSLKELRANLAKIREEMMGPLKADTKLAERGIEGLDNVIAGSRKQLDDIVRNSTDEHTQLTEFTVGIRNDIDDLERQLANKDRYFRGVTTKERNDVVRHLNKKLRTLRQLRDEAETRVAGLPRQLRDEAQRRTEELFAPLKQAKDALAAAEEAAATQAGRPSPRALQQARQVMAGNDEEAWSALREEYRQARDLVESQGAGLPRTKGGALTADAERQMKEARRVIAESEAGRIPSESAGRGAPFKPSKAEIADRARLDALPGEIADVRAELRKPLKRFKDPEKLIAQSDARRVQARKLDELLGEQQALQKKFLGTTSESAAGEHAAAREAYAAEQARLNRVSPKGGRNLAGSAKYDRDEAALLAKQQELADTPLRHTKIRAKLEREQAALQAKFNPGGEHYAEKYARQTLMRQADAEKAAAEHPSVLAARKKVAQQEWMLSQRPSVERMNAGGMYSPSSGPMPPTFQGRPMGRPVETEQEAVNVLRNAARTPDVRDLARYNQQIPETEARLANLATPGAVDVERDLNVPAQVQNRRDAVMGPIIRERELAGQIHDAVLEDTTARLRSLDDEGIGVQAELADDLADRQSLINKRDQLQKIAPVLKAADPRKGNLAELGAVVNEIEGVAKANPLLDSDTLTATESLLHTYADNLAVLQAKDVSAQQVRKMVTAADRGKLAPVMLTALNDNWHMLYEGVLKQGDTIIDAQLHEMFKNLIVLDKQPKVFGRVFNSLTNLFKTYATLSPGFHVRNALTGIFMNTSDGVALARQLEGNNLWRQYMKNGDEWLNEQTPRVRKAFEATFGSGAGGRYTESGVASLSTDVQNKTLARIYNAAAQNKVTRLAQRAGERVEGALRLGMALDSVDRGESVTEALTRITRVHFDYSQTSELDDIAKRYIPFWTYMSRNLPLQISQMWTKPGVYATYESAVRNFSSPDAPYTPSYWLDSGGFNTGLKVPKNSLPVLKAASGLPIYLTPDTGYNRLGQDIAALTSPAKMAAQANPLLTTPFEYASKTDFFTGRHFDPATDYEKVGGVTGIPLNILATLLNQTNEAGEVSSNFANAVRGVNPLMDREMRLLPDDPEGKKRQAESIARFLGVPARTLTPKQQDAEFYRQYYKLVDQQRAAKAVAKRQAQRAAG